MNVLHVNHSNTNSSCTAIAKSCLHQRFMVGGTASSSLFFDFVKTGCSKVKRIQHNHKKGKTAVSISLSLRISDVNLLSTFGIANHPLHKSKNTIQFYNLYSIYFNYLEILVSTIDKSRMFQRILRHILNCYITYRVDLKVLEPLDRDVSWQLPIVLLNREVLIFGVPFLSNPRLCGDFVVQASHGLPTYSTKLR